MKKIILFFGFLFIAPLVVYAVSPSVASFITGSRSINSGQYASFSWNISNAGGYSFLVSCAQGLKFRKIDGSIFACGTSLSSTATSIDGIDLSVRNFSVGTQSFTAKITPKDASGIDISSASQEIQITVAPALKIIENVTGTSTIASSVPYALSWSADLTDGVNLSFKCSPTIRISAPSYATSTYLPCDTYVFPNGLSPSSSIALIFDNSSKNKEDIAITLTPMMEVGVYNGARSESITISVGSNVATEATVTSFAIATTTPEHIPNGFPVSFSWLTASSTGANIRISCNEHVTTTITTLNASSTPKCSTLAFNTAMPSNGSGTIVFSNDNLTIEPITLTLVPSRSLGGFDATHGKDIIFQIQPNGAILTNSPISNTPNTNNATTSPSIAVVNSTSAKNIFTKNLIRGTYNSDVRTLQEFLRKDKTIYPEGIVNGNFGGATERAVKRFQSKYKIANEGNQGYGSVGPKTRAFLNIKIVE